MALALDFIFQFAQQNQFFTGGDVLDAYRKAGHPDPECGWRNTWAALITKGANTGWYVKAGRVAPKSKQSHTRSMVQWQSRLFKGVQHLTGETAKDTLEGFARLSCFGKPICARPCGRRMNWVLNKE